MIIPRYLHGWDELEPTIIGSIAQGMSILLLGKHGCGKTSFGRFVSEALSNGEELKLIKYSMDKENLISMVGIPNADALKQGKIDYATHERSIFNADVVIFDEITRAPKENQNMVLEILEEKTVFGKPLKYKFAIATANDQTYKGAYKLDAALLDRFVVVLPIPSFGDKNTFFGAEEIKKMIMLNFSEREKAIEDSNELLRRYISEVKNAHDQLLRDKNIVDNVMDFSSRFFSVLRTNINEYNSGSKEKVEVSPRQISDHFPKLILAISSYYKHIYDNHEYLQQGAWDAIKYSIGVKLGFPLEKLNVLYEELKDVLVDIDSLLAKIKIAISTGSFVERVAALEKHIEFINSRLDVDEKINIIGNMITESENFMEPDITEEEDEKLKEQNLKIGTANLIKLNEILTSHNFNSQCENRVQLRLFNIGVNAGVLVDCAMF